MNKLDVEEILIVSALTLALTFILNFIFIVLTGHSMGELGLILRHYIMELI